LEYASTFRNITRFNRDAPDAQECRSKMKNDDFDDDDDDGDGSLSGVWDAPSAGTQGEIWFA